MAFCRAGAEFYFFILPQIYTRVANLESELEHCKSKITPLFLCNNDFIAFNGVTYSCLQIKIESN